MIGHRRGRGREGEREGRRRNQSWALRHRAPGGVERGRRVATEDQESQKTPLHWPGTGCVHAKIFGVAIMLVQLGCMELIGGRLAFAPGGRFQKHGGTAELRGGNHTTGGDTVVGG